MIFNQQQQEKKLEELNKNLQVLREKEENCLKQISQLVVLIEEDQLVLGKMG